MSWLNAESQPSQVLSQETRDPASIEGRLPFLKGSSSAHNLASYSIIAAKSNKSGSTYSRAFDRLYYEHNKAGRYGKISDLISGVMASIAEPVFFNNEPKKKEDLPREKKVPRRDLVEMKREIFLTKLSMDNKQKSLADLRKFAEMQESDLEKKKKLAEESKNLYMKFLDSEGKKVKQLQEQHLNYEAELQNQSDQLVKLQREIKDMEYALKRVKDDIEEAKSFESFIEMVAEPWHGEEIAEIKAHNQKIQDAILVPQLESQRIIQASPLKSRRKYNLSKRETKPPGTQGSGFLLTQPEHVKSTARSLSRLEDGESSNFADPEEDLRLQTLDLPI